MKVSPLVVENILFWYLHRVYYDLLEAKEFTKIASEEFSFELTLDLDFRCFRCETFAHTSRKSSLLRKKGEETPSTKNKKRRYFQNVLRKFKLNFHNYKFFQKNSTLFATLRNWAQNQAHMWKNFLCMLNIRGVKFQENSVVIFVVPLTKEHQNCPTPIRMKPPS